MGMEWPPDVISALSARNGMASTAWLIEIRPAGDGATGRAEVSVRDGQATRDVALRPARLAAFWDEAERLGCWSLTDWSDMATDLSVYYVYLRRGEQRLDITCYGFLSQCPQQRLVREIERLGGIGALFKKAEAGASW